MINDRLFTLRDPFDFPLESERLTGSLLLAVNGPPTKAPLLKVYFFQSPFSPSGIASTYMNSASICEAPGLVE